jgi:hypothetical protein
VLRRWPGPGPGVQATEQFRISRFGGLAIRLEDQPDRHGSPRRPRRSNLTILSESYSQIKFQQSKSGLGKVHRPNRLGFGHLRLAQLPDHAAAERPTQ